LLQFCDPYKLFVTASVVAEDGIEEAALATESVGVVGVGVDSESACPDFEFCLICMESGRRTDSALNDDGKSDFPDGRLNEEVSQAESLEKSVEIESFEVDEEHSRDSSWSIRDFR
jgi:hypothetical protein